MSSPSVPRWKAAALRSALALPGLRSPRVRGVLWSRWLAVKRAWRRRLEARGDFSRSRPALDDLDALLERHLPTGTGFFVEAGANDGYTQSNTYYLERARGWSGLLVEPMPTLAAEATRERPGARVVNAALVSEEVPGATIRMRFGGLMSIVAGSRGDEREEQAYVAAAFELGVDEPYEADVPARTLSALLSEMGDPKIDLLSLDAEGYEPQILAGLDLGRHRPALVLVEVQDMDAGLAAITDELPGYEVVEALSPRDLLLRDAG